MISGIASPLIARPPTIPPAGPTGRCRASTAPSNSVATRAASRNDIAASGPPSDTARIDFIISLFSPETLVRLPLSLALIGDRAHTFTFTDPMHDRQGEQHHP